MNGYNRQYRGPSYGNRQRGAGGNGYQGQGRNQGNGQPREDGDYPPNTGQLSPNARARNDNDPHMSGVMNIEINGQRYTFFISGWENKPGIFRLSFNPADGSGGGRFRQNSPQIRGNFRQNGRSNGGRNYRPQNGQDQDSYQEDYQPRQNGAMSRARPIPEPRYEDGPPSPDYYPDGPDDAIPF